MGPRALPLRHQLRKPENIYEASKGTKVEHTEKHRVRLEQEVKSD